MTFQLTPLESLNNMAACEGSKRPSEFFLELDIVPRDSRRVSGSRELLRKRAPINIEKLIMKNVYIMHYFKVT